MVIFDYILGALRLKDTVEAPYKGYFLTVLALQTAYPTATEGDFACVRNATGADYIYIWDADTEAWEKSDGSVSAIWGAVTGDINLQTDLITLLNGKQATLESGTNIKSINGTSLLGSGDLVIPTFAWGATIAGTSGTGLGLTISNSATAGTIGQSITIGNTQTGIHTGLKIDVGTSSQAHLGISILATSVSANAKAIKVDFGATGTGKGIYFTDGSATDSNNRICIDTSFNGGRTQSFLKFYNNNNTSYLFWNYGMRSGVDDVADDQALVSNVSHTASLVTGRTANFVDIRLSRTNSRSSGTTTDNYNLVNFQRSTTQSTGGGTTIASGSVLKLTNIASVPNGTLTDSVSILSLVQDNDSTGGHILFNAYTGTPTATGTRWHDGVGDWIIGGIRQGFEKVIFSQTADKTIANTVTETSLFGTGQGTLTLSADFLRIGKTIRIKQKGYISTGTSQSSTITVKLGTVTLISVGPSTLPNGLSNNLVETEIDITCRTTGASGSVFVQGKTLIATATGITTVSMRPLVTTAPVTVNTTITNAIDVTYTWAGADPANSITTTNASVEILW